MRKEDDSRDGERMGINKNNAALASTATCRNEPSPLAPSPWNTPTALARSQNESLRNTRYVLPFTASSLHMLGGPRRKHVAQSEWWIVVDFHTQNCRPMYFQIREWASQLSLRVSRRRSSTRLARFFMQAAHERCGGDGPHYIAR